MQPQAQAVSEEDGYRELVRNIVHMGKVDRSIVMQKAHVGAGAALSLINRMEADGVISKPDRKTSERCVLITPDELKARERKSGTIELDADSRAALELLEPTLGEREEVTIDGIRTEFGLESADAARDVIMALAARGKTGEPDAHGVAMVLVSPSGNGTKPRKSLKAAPPTRPPAPRPAGIRLHDSVGISPPTLRGDQNGSAPVPKPATSPVPPPTATPTIATKPAPPTPKPTGCRWPDCTATQIFGRELCSRDYFRLHKCKRAKGPNAPWPTLDEAVAWWNARDHTPRRRPRAAIMAEPAVRDLASSSANVPTATPTAKPRESAPLATEKPWQRQLAEAHARTRAVEEEKRALEATIDQLRREKGAIHTTANRLQAEVDEHQAAWKALAEFIERQPVLRRFLRIR